MDAGDNPCREALTAGLWQKSVQRGPVTFVGDDQLIENRFRHRGAGTVFDRVMACHSFW